MTEAEWLACTELTPMESCLFHLGRSLGKRKWTLFHVACCRQIWPILTDWRCRRAVEIAEQYVDGLASKEALTAARDAVPVRHEKKWTIGSLARSVAGGSIGFSCEAARELWLRQPGFDCNDTAADAIVMLRQVEALRDIVGNPFHATLSPKTDWLLWNDGAVQKIAQAIYDERRFADLPALADALEDAGYADAWILAHLRGPTEHVRGCWALDLLLRKY